MSKTGIFVLIFTLFPIYKAQGGCDSEICSEVCREKGFPNSKCSGNSCDCSSEKKCSEMIEVTCDNFCDKLQLSGECDENDYCVCKAVFQTCPNHCDCVKGCLEFPEGKSCKAEDGIVMALPCLNYGPITTCSCHCQLPKRNPPTSYLYTHLLNTFTPNAAEEPSEYTVTGQFSLFSNWSITIRKNRQNTSDPQ